MYMRGHIFLIDGGILSDGSAIYGAPSVMDRASMDCVPFIIKDIDK